MEFVSILFYVFSALAVFASIAVVTSNNPVYSVLWLIFAFFNVAGVFVLLGAELVAMLLVIVYVGAVAVLFLFVVMMLNVKPNAMKEGFKLYLPIGALLVAVLFVELAAVMYHSSEKLDLHKKTITSINNEKKVLDLADAVKNAHKAEENSKKLKAGDKLERVINKNTNTHNIGKVLYTKYILYFQMSGLILLVAMISAIVLSLRTREGVRKQNINNQVSRNSRTAIEIVKVETGKGI